MRGFYTTDETWSELVTLGLDEVKNFAKKEGINREISKLGLTERETQQLIKQFKNERIDSGRGARVVRETQSRGQVNRTSSVNPNEAIEENLDGFSIAEI